MATKKNYWLKSGFFTLFERGSVFLFGFGSTFILFRALTKEQFGIWAIFLAITSFIEVGRIGLLQNALVKYLATTNEENPQEYPEITSASFVLNLILSLFSMILLIVTAPIAAHYFNSPQLNTLLPIYAITTTLLIPFFQFNFIQQGNFEFKGIFWSNFTRQCLFFCYVFSFYWSGAAVSLAGLATWQIVTALGGTIVSWWFARPYLRFDRKISWDWVKKLFHFGKFVFGTNVSTMLYKTIDKMMLGALLSPVAVGIYDAAIRITNLADVPTFSIASIVFPQSAKQMKDNGTEAIKNLYEKSVGAILAFLVPFIGFIWLFPEFVITIIASEKYLDAAPILKWTILFGLFMPFAVQFGTVLDSIGKPKINFRFTVFSMILNVVFNYIFITQFGIIGAAYGTIMTYTITFLMMQIILNRMLGVKAWNAFPHIFSFYGQAWDLAKEKLSRQEAIGIAKVNDDH